MEYRELTPGRQIKLPSIMFQTEDTVTSDLTLLFFHNFKLH